MKKDVIYIDIEDDITAIIGKVKPASAKVVALVPPKRTGALQSVVNLKLLKKAAGEAGKQMVLITNDHSLLSLASGLKLPVAKNLQTPPAIPLAASLEQEGEDVINGAELPVGEIAAAAGQVEHPHAPAPSVADEISQHVDLKAVETAPTKPKPKDVGKKVRIPDFQRFRKWLFLGGIGGVLLIGFLVWAIKIAPHASVTITAKTSQLPIDRLLGLDTNYTSSDTKQLQLKPTVQKLKKSVTADFDATGTKDTGNKAIGSVTITNSYDSKDVTIPAGAVFTANTGQKFASTGAVTVPGASVAGGGIKPGTATASIQASDIGQEYNLPAQPYTIADMPNLSGSGSPTSGGTREKVSIITQDDVTKAKATLSLPDQNSAKAELHKQFGSDLQIIEESFAVDTADPVSTPAVGDQAKQGKVTIDTTYTLTALNRSDIKQVLADALKDALVNKPNQSVFNDGADSVTFKSFQKQGTTATVNLDTTGYIGTTINTSDLAKQIEGKRYGDIEQIANQIPGVNKVDINFSPFWVTTAPRDPSKIDIKFSVL